jgi:hypothetical protein
VVPASGVQIYECLAKKDASTQFEWTFKAPEALLYGEGQRVNTVGGQDRARRLQRGRLLLPQEIAGWK